MFSVPCLPYLYFPSHIYTVTKHYLYSRGWELGYDYLMVVKHSTSSFLLIYDLRFSIFIFSAWKNLPQLRTFWIKRCILSWIKPAWSLPETVMIHCFLPFSCSRSIMWENSYHPLPKSPPLSLHGAIKYKNQPLVQWTLTKIIKFWWEWNYNWRLKAVPH